ncbi:hypothetical protein Bca4012_067036 [Brassica carinata]|uniref:Uncharacterized protein n=1 Tax=Brassica carinata TaxID=52824 RepID=A0A8X8B0B2_BRACI|nr:hypothetical protein Bca52824_019349 [Brassica carinata]
MGPFKSHLKQRLLGPATITPCQNSPVVVLLLRFNVSNANFLSYFRYSPVNVFDKMGEFRLEKNTEFMNLLLDTHCKEKGLSKLKLIR